MRCPQCQFENVDGARFCNECGDELKELQAFAPVDFTKPQSHIPKHPADKIQATRSSIEGERKHATVLFSDLGDYSALTEKLDPEEVKEIMSLIFREIARLAKSYDGTIERFFGDEVLILFGVPKAHEDDPIRAIRAAIEINALIDRQSARFAEKIGRPLAMHIGINTGLVVTGDEYIEKGRHGLTGDAINLGARLGRLSKPGEILVGSETYRQAMHYFEFESLEAIKIKGKAEPIQIYKVLSHREQPPAFHNTQGARADLIGRDQELAVLEQAVQQLLKGQGSIVSICGDAGTGKSRLIREFRGRLDPDEIRWHEGHAYGYTQNTPYYPLIDLLTRAFELKEGDAPERMQRKIESGLAYLLGEGNRAAAYIGGLFSLSYPDSAKGSPEFWKFRLHASIKEMVSALAKQGPTVICFEDLHWADPSFIELLTNILKYLDHSILFVCVYRSSFQLFNTYQHHLNSAYREIRLQDLSATDAQAMLRSLLKSENIPVELMEFVENKAEGNPFYLEEVVNSLIESQILTRANGEWKLTRSLGEADIPSSINSVLTARIDRLPKDVKRVLQEASVIGRAFFYEILKTVSDLKAPIDDYLTGLEQLDLIRVRAKGPNREYIFKHALTREVVYNGILIKERQAIHERIGIAIETLFKNRLAEFYETLAYHFSHSRNVRKAVYYLMLSGEKNLRRYALDESYKFYEDVYKILSEKTSKTNEEKRLLIDLLIKWSFVFFWRADYAGLMETLGAQKALVDSLQDREMQGMFYASLGFAFGQIGRSRESYEYLLKALKFCQEAKNERYTAFCCSWLTQACEELGLLEDAIVFGKQGQKIAKQLPWDLILFNETHVWMAVAYYYRGECREIEKVVNAFLEKGEETSEPHLTSNGYIFKGMMYQIAGDYAQSIKEFEEAIRLSKDPMILYNGNMMLGLSYLSLGMAQEAEDKLNDLLFLTRHLATWVRKPQSKMLLNAVRAAKGNLSRSIKNLHRMQAHFSENGQRFSLASTEFILGNIYFQMIQNKAPKDFEVIVKNIGFLIKTIPFAAKKAEHHYRAAIQTAKEIGAKGVLGQSYLDLGRLYKIKGRTDDARHHISDAIKIFEECGSHAFLEQARGVLESLR